jgi:hypothetical protein
VTVCFQGADVGEAVRRETELQAVGADHSGVPRLM